VGDFDGGVEIEDDGSRLFLDFETDEEVQVSIGDMKERERSRLTV
jgi:hypothetical protein